MRATMDVFFSTLGGLLDRTPQRGSSQARLYLHIKSVYTTSFVRESSGRFLDKYTNPRPSQPFSKAPF